MISKELNRFEIPILIIIFNRPDLTRLLVKQLRKIKAKEIYIVADGPRDNFPSDNILCAEARDIINQIDWECNIHRLFHDTNKGCGHNPVNGINWVFESVDACIILEDDCLPDTSFFKFCKELLIKYQDDKRIMMISGNNNLLGKKSIHNSYFYSINTQTHGWATWKRAWNEYDFYMTDWPITGSFEWLCNYLGDKKYAKLWFKIFNDVFSQAKSNPMCSVWDFQWTYACWKNHALNIIPSVNLVTNNGYGTNATHLTSKDHPLARLSVEPISFPLNSPPTMLQDYEADKILRKNVYGFRNIFERMSLKSIKILKYLYMCKVQKCLKNYIEK